MADPKGPKAFAVGYRKPPEHSRWKKGQSGNPAGKAKGTLNVSTVVKKIASQKINLKDKNGKTITTSYLEAHYKMIANASLNGNNKSQMLLTQEFNKHLPTGPEPPAEGPISQSDLDTLNDKAAILELLNELTGDKDGNGGEG